MSDMTEQEIAQALTSAGYTEHRVPTPFSHADRWFQRRVKLNEHTLYFLNVGLYDRRRHGIEFGPRYSLQLDTSLYHPQWAESSVGVTLGVPATVEGISGAEAMATTLFAAGFEPDRDNNDDLDGARRALAKSQGR